MYLVDAPSPICPQAKAVQFQVENVSHADEYDYSPGRILYNTVAI